LSNILVDFVLDFYFTELFFLLFSTMAQPVSESLAILSASVLPALEAVSHVASKVPVASSDYISARHRLDSVLDEAARIRGQKRAATNEMLSKRQSLGSDLAESSHDPDSGDPSSPPRPSIANVCHGIVQVAGSISKSLHHCTIVLITSSGTNSYEIGSNSSGLPPYWILCQQA
jgi:hypothetical protein